MKSDSMRNLAFIRVHDLLLRMSSPHILSLRVHEVCHERWYTLQRIEMPYVFTRVRDVLAAEVRHEAE